MGFGVLLVPGSFMGLIGDQAHAGLDQAGITAVATIEDVKIEERHRRRGADYRQPVASLKFRTPDGRVIRDRVDLSDDEYKLATANKRIAVRYLPANPAIHEFAAFAESHHPRGAGIWVKFGFMLGLG